MLPLVIQEIEIHSYECDVNKRLKAVALQNLLQEAGYKGSEFCRCGYDMLREKNLFWALNRIRFQILETPLWGDKVILQTWSRAQAGPLWHRNFKMFRPAAPDTPIMLATSAWTLVDLGNRSLFTGNPGFEPSFHYEEDTLPFCTKIIVPRELEQQEAGYHRVVWSDIDTNQHANNCSYTQWVIDALPLDYIRSHRIKEVEINYFHEILPGENILLLTARSGDTWFVSGKSGDKLCFVEKLIFD